MSPDDLAAEENLVAVEAHVASLRAEADRLEAAIAEARAMRRERLAVEAEVAALRERYTAAQMALKMNAATGEA